MRAGIGILAWALCGAAFAGRQGAVWTDDRGFAINAHGGGILHHQGTYWWYGEHKVYGRAGNRAHVGVHVYSSRDLLRWTDRGVALAVSPDAQSPIFDGCAIERPKVVFCRKTGKFVMYFHLERQPLLAAGKGYAAAETGVAVADRPEGPFRLVRAGRPKNAAGKAYESRDQTLFADDDGSVWQFYSSDGNLNLRINRLTDDCLGYTGESHEILHGDGTEAPAVFRQGGKYWMIGSACTGWAPNEARLYVAEKITGPWKRLGCPCRGVNPENGLGPEKTWGGQSAFVLPVAGRPGVFVAMFDVWRPDNQLDSRYLWLPVTFVDGVPQISWVPEFTPPAGSN